MLLKVVLRVRKLCSNVKRELGISLKSTADIPLLELLYETTLTTAYLQIRAISYSFIRL